MLTPEERKQLIERIRRFPAELEALVAGLDPQTLTTPYVPGEWTIAQNVHHTADSHMNSYIRLKLMLTEERPSLKPYDETQWALFPDATPPDFTLTFQLLRGLHGRWATVFAGLTEADWQRVGIHQADGEITVEDLLRNYVAHGQAHLDQIRRVLAARGMWV
ncbi:MAG: DinB family protein [Anaerolineae bacterium]|nr:DinB family protein [Anaerolineae bacterium]